jgi:hypothetical protein
VVRGRRGVDDEAGARGDLLALGGPRHPDVLADRQADRDAVDLDQRRAVSRLEVAALVEDPVVGELDLAVDGGDLAPRQHGQRVVGGRRHRVDRRARGGPFHPLGESDQRDGAGDLPRQVLDGPPDGVQEVAAQQKVLRRIAGQAELGQDGELGAGLGRPLDRFRCEGDVPLDVAHGRVQLGQGEAQVR